MTNIQIIHKYLPYPLSDMVFKNVLNEHDHEWLNSDSLNFLQWNGRVKMYHIINHSFTWEFSIERDEFWRDVYTKFINKDL